MKKINVLLTMLLITSLVLLCSGCADITSSINDIPTSGTITISVSDTFTATDEPEEYAKYSALTDVKITEDSYITLSSTTPNLDHEVLIPADNLTLKSTDYTVDETQVVMKAIVELSYSGLYKSATYKLNAETLSFELSDGTNTYVIACSNGLSLAMSNLSTEADDDVKEVILHFPNGEPYAGGSPEPIKVHSVNGDKSKHYLAQVNLYEWTSSSTESVNPDDYTSMPSEEAFKKDMSYCINLELTNTNNVIFSPDCKIYMLTSDGEKKPLAPDLLELPTPGVTPPTTNLAQYISLHLIFSIKDAPVINAVSISPETVQVEKGKTQLFTAKVDRMGNAPKGMTWNISGNVSAETKIDETGLLTVGADETAESLTITVTSVFDPTQSASVEVDVIEPIVATPEPTVQPTTEPTTEGTTNATTSPTIRPTVTPTATPTTTPTSATTPTAEPTKKPVKKKVTIKFKKKSVKVKKGKKVALKVTIKGAKKAKFSVNKKGKKVVKLMKKKPKSVVVKGKKKGKAFIYAKAGNKKAKCTVKVK